MKDTFAPVPNSILKNPKLSAGSKLCFGRLLQYKGKGKVAFPSVQALSRELAVTTRQTRKYLRKLEEANLLRIIRTPGNRNSYILHSRGLNDSSPLNDSSSTPEQQFTPPRNDSSGATKEIIKKKKKTTVQSFLDVDFFPEKLKQPDFIKSWETWIGYRAKEKKSRITESTAKAQLKKLSKISIQCAIETINRSIENGWTGIFPENTDTQQDSNTKPREEFGGINND